MATVSGCSSLSRSWRALIESGSTSGPEGGDGTCCLMSMLEASAFASRSWVFIFAARTTWMEAVDVTRPFCCGVRQMRSPIVVARVRRFL